MIDYEHGRVFRLWRGAIRLVHNELALVITGLVLVLGIWAFAQITDEVIEHETHTVDHAVMQWLRNGENPMDPIGPPWVEQVAQNVTALGSYTIAGLLTLMVAAFLAITQHYRSMAALVVAVIGGIGLTHLAKAWVDRTRPDELPHLVAVHTPSFPSGHAMTAAVVYFTLAVLLCQAFGARRERLFFLGVALILTLMVGVSRVYLGVHYPTDVLAGWAAGLAWAALVCGLAHTARRLGRTKDVG